MTGLRNLPVDLMESWFCFVGRVLKDLKRQPIMWDDHFSQRIFATKHCPNATKDWIVQAWKMEYPIGDTTAMNDDFPFKSISSPMKSVCLLSLLSHRSNLLKMYFIYFHLLYLLLLSIYMQIFLKVFGLSRGLHRLQPHSAALALHRPTHLRWMCHDVDRGAPKFASLCSFEDSEPKDVMSKVFPRFMAIAERFWGGRMKSTKMSII